MSYVDSFIHPDNVRKCLSLHGSRPVFYFERWGRVLVAFVDKAGKEREFSRREFADSFVTFSQALKFPAAMAILNAIPDWREWRKKQEAGKNGNQD